MRQSVRGPRAYFDLIPALESALQRNGAMLECGTTGSAIKLVQRMNQYRILDRKMNHQRRLKRELPPGGNPEADHRRFIEMENRENLYYLRSKFDVLTIKRIDTKVIMEVKPESPWLTIEDLNGNPIETEPVPFEDIYEIEHDKAFDRTHEDVMRFIEKEQRTIVPGGTTQAPREKHDPTKPLRLTDE